MSHCRIKIFAIHKDEPDLLDGFLLYHAELVGWRNLYVIDNYSTIPQCEKILQQYTPFGLNVQRQADFVRKDEHITNWMKTEQNNCDFLIPLDVDEFIVFAQDAGKWSCAKSDILHEIETLPFHARYAFPKWCFSVHTRIEHVDPLVEITSFLPKDYGWHNKKFFRAKTFVSTVPGGNHMGEVIGYESGECFNTRLFLLHFHDCGAQRLLTKARNVCQAFGYDKLNEQQLERVIQQQQINYHYARTLLEYHRFGWAGILKSTIELNHPLTPLPTAIVFTEFSTLVPRLRDAMHLPVDFNWKLYLSMHNDLSKVFSTENQAIVHYILHGKNEKRCYSLYQSTNTPDVKR